MMSFTQKNPAEIELFTMDFVDNLAPYETINSATATIEIKSGVDPSVGTMLTGVCLISGTKVSQMIQHGVDGNYYYLNITIVTTNQTLVGRAILPVSVEK